jgi:hypothetical protein
VRNPRRSLTAHARSRPCRAFQTFGGFTSGIGIHYPPSAITRVTVSDDDGTAGRLIPGRRVPPQTVLRAADARTYEMQDLLPADARFKLLVFAGDTAHAAQRARVGALAPGIARAAVRGGEVCVLVVVRTPKEVVECAHVPGELGDKLRLLFCLRY